MHTASIRQPRQGSTHVPVASHSVEAAEPPEPAAPLAPPLPLRPSLPPVPLLPPMGSDMEASLPEPPLPPGGG